MHISKQFRINLAFYLAGVLTIVGLAWWLAGRERTTYNIPPIRLNVDDWFDSFGISLC